jgi:hypothetical protein
MRRNRGESLQSARKKEPYGTLEAPRFLQWQAPARVKSQFRYSGFWQINIKEDHKERTGFTFESGQYEFNRLPFGLSNSPSNIQRLMDVVLKSLVGTECFMFLDDIIVFSSTAEDHALRLENVMHRFDEANLRLRPAKCVFAVTIAIFGLHIVR